VVSECCEILNPSDRRETGAELLGIPWRDQLGCDEDFSEIQYCYQLSSRLLAILPATLGNYAAAVAFGVQIETTLLRIDNIRQSALGSSRPISITSNQGLLMRTGV
jgi:hypothetical protein